MYLIRVWYPDYASNYCHSIMKTETMQDVQEGLGIWRHWYNACLPCLHEGLGSTPSTRYGGTHMQSQHVQEAETGGSEV